MNKLAKDFVRVFITWNQKQNMDKKTSWWPDEEKISYNEMIKISTIFSSV